MKLLPFIALLIIAALPSMAKPANLWSRSNVIIGSFSPIMELTGHRIDNVFSDNTGMFYNTGSLIIFEKNPEDEYFIEWETKGPADVGWVEVCANCDIPSTNRKAGRFEIYGRKAEEDPWTLMFGWTPPKGVYKFEDPAQHLVASGRAAGKGFRYFRARIEGNPEESPGGSPILYGLRAYASDPRKPAEPAVRGEKYVTYLLHDQGPYGYKGMQNFVDGAKKRGSYYRARFTILLNGSEPDYIPESRDFWRQLYDDGHEIGCERAEQTDRIAAWLGIPAEEMTTVGADLFGDCDPEKEVLQNAKGITAEVNSCVEGNSLAEFWDIPHNWEGCPIMPYYVQWDPQNPLATARVNRELDRSSAVLELSWGTRTPWHNYDRFPIPQCWHVGEPSKPGQWRVGQLVRKDTLGGWWNAECRQLEKNLEAGRVPFLYLSVTIESCWFAPEVQSGAVWDECLSNGLDLADMFLRRGWKIKTCRDFTRWYSEKWPCPEAPAMIFLLEDTLANREDRDGLVIEGNGHLVHAETKYFQITDSDNRLAPELVIAYACRTPNLLRGGYTFADPAKYPGPEVKTGHYASTTGNAIFWSPSRPLTDLKGHEYFPAYKAEECRERAFTFYLGDDYRDYMFAPGEFSRVRRISDDEVTWTKEQLSPAPGTDIRLKYEHTVKGPKHIITVSAEGDDAEGLPARFRLCPYFHQGWDMADPDTPEGVPDPRTAGQERNVFASLGGETFAWSEQNAETVTRTFAPGKIRLDIYNRNPGKGDGADDNPLMNRGFTLTCREKGSVTCTDLAGPSEYVVCEIDFGRHEKGRTYTLEFEYWNERERARKQDKR
ncbi:MAG: hypothetical protein IJT95_02170 [Abditibacteriota bacterium]|nr:hypothetical protein [Abditibacteriota bacterium]